MRAVRRLAGHHRLTRLRWVLRLWLLSLAGTALTALAQATPPGAPTVEPSALGTLTRDTLPALPGVIPEGLLAVQADAPRDAAPWGIQLETTLTHTRWRETLPGRPAAATHLVADVRHRWALDERVHAVLSLRSDYGMAPGPDTDRHALREAWFSVESDTAGYTDVGRVQWRNGVAQGYNPTDYLKRGATLDLGTQDPLTLRDNRLGTVMLRQQWLDTWGSVAMAYLPRLSHRPDDATGADDTTFAWHKTNGAHAALLKIAPNVSERISLDLLAYGRAGEAPQWGGNVTALIDDAILIYAEASLQRGAPQTAWGAQWTHAANLTLNVEHHRDGTTARQALYLRGSWSDALQWRHLDLSAFVRRDLDDRSRLWQVDAFWAVNDRWSLRAALGGVDGTPSSLMGRAPVRRYALLGARVAF